MQFLRLHTERYFTILVTTFMSLLAAVATLADNVTDICPEMCRCNTTTNVVRCDHATLTSLPDSFPRRMRELHLSDNRITSLPDDLFVLLPSVRALFVDNNTLSDILFDAPAFARNYLRVLSLRGNRIENVSALALSGVRRLRVLDLGYNHISYLHAHAFSRLISLRVLRLNANQLHSLPVGLFRDLTQLVELDLSDNLLATFDIGTTLWLGSLRSLNLSDNELIKLHYVDSNVTSTLQTLDLTNNLLKTIPNEMLTLNLYELRLVNNHIVCNCHALALWTWLRNMTRHKNNHSTVLCQSPVELKGANLSDVDEDRLVCHKLVLHRHRNFIFRRPQKNRYAYGYGAVTYDARLGWQTAATLSGMLVFFLLCIGVDKLKRLYYKRRRQRREQLETELYVSLLSEAQASRADVLQSLYCSKCDGSQFRATPTDGIGALLQPTAMNAAAAAMVAATTGATAAAICQLLAVKPVPSASSLHKVSSNAPSRNQSYDSHVYYPDRTATDTATLNFALTGMECRCQNKNGDAAGLSATFTVGGASGDSPPRNIGGSACRQNSASLGDVSKVSETHSMCTKQLNQSETVL